MIDALNLTPFEGIARSQRVDKAIVTAERERERRA
jgi:hypothetical protein